MNEDLKQRVRKARKSFLAIAVSYFMGLFNDNFFKEAALFIAVAENNLTIQSGAAALFTICYLFSAAPAGWCADRFSKGNVIILSKLAELVAMIAGAFGMWYGNWWLILAMIGIMGAQSAFFSPSMNGSIPELYPEEYVQKANSIVKVISTTAIFVGMAAAGYTLDKVGVSFFNIPTGRFLIGVYILIAAVTGFVVSLWAPKIEAKSPDLKFPWKGPIESVMELMAVKKDKQLFFVVCTDIFLWALATTITLLMVNLGTIEFGLSNTATAVTKIMFLIGIALGGILSNFIVNEHNFFKYIVPTLLLTSGFLLTAGILPAIFYGSRLIIYFVIMLISFTGVAGGMNLIPVESFIQIRPDKNKKGRVIAAVNFGVFVGMTIGAGVLFLLNKFVAPSAGLTVLGIITLLYALGAKKWLQN